MAGLEVAGLALGAVPLLIGAIEQYETIMAVVNKYRKFSTKLRNMYDTLALERTIFRAECVLLLATDISKNEAEIMLSTPSHSLWRDETFNHRMSRCFGSLGDAMTEVTRSVVNALGRIALKINELGHITGDSTPDMQQSNMQWRSTVRTKLKFALSSQASISKDLESLAKLNERFAMLSSQIRQLENLYSAPKPAAQSQTPTAENVTSFARIRLASLDLYSALLQSCPTDHEHFLRFGLNGLSSLEGKSAIASKIRFDVQYCSRYISDSRNVSEPTKQTPNHALLIESSTASDSTTSYVHTSSEVLTKSTAFTTAQGKKPVVLSGRRTATSAQVDDLCYRLSRTAPKTSLVRAMSATLELEGQGHFKHTVVSSRHSAWSQQTTSLAETLFQIKHQGRNFEIPQFQRLSIAEQLGTKVLQMYGTPWLARTLHSHELYFLGGPVDAQEVTRLGYTAFEPETIYMDIALEAEPTTSLVRLPTATASDVTLTTPPQSRFGLRSGPPNTWLYHLGILLIELAYHTPFTDLVTELKSEYDALSIPLSSNPVTAEYHIACQLADNVGSTLGVGYASIVRRCLRCEFDVASSDLDDGKLRQSVYENVVCKLRDLAGAFRTLQVATAV